MRGSGGGGGTETGKWYTMHDDNRRLELIEKLSVRQIYANFPSTQKES